MINAAGKILFYGESISTAEGRKMEGGRFLFKLPPLPPPPPW